MKKLCLIIALILLSGCAVTDRLMYGTHIDPLLQKKMPKLSKDATAIFTTPLECTRRAHSIQCFCSLAYSFDPKKKSRQPFLQSFHVLKTAFKKSLKKKHLTSLIEDLGSFGRRAALDYAGTDYHEGPMWIDRPHVIPEPGYFYLPGPYASDYYWKELGLVNLTKGAHYYKFDRVVMFYSGQLFRWQSVGGYSRFFYIIPENHKAILIIPIDSKTAKILHPANGKVKVPGMPVIRKLDAEIHITALDVKFKEKCCPKWRDYCMKMLKELLECQQRVGVARTAKCKWDYMCTKFLQRCNKTKRILIESIWTYKERRKNLLWLQAMQGPLLEGSPW